MIERPSLPKNSAHLTLPRCPCMIVLVALGITNGEKSWRRVSTIGDILGWYRDTSIWYATACLKRFSSLFGGTYTEPEDKKDGHQCHDICCTHPHNQTRKSRGRKTPTILDRVLDLEHALKLFYEPIATLSNSLPVLEWGCVVDRFRRQQVAQVLKLDGCLLMLLQGFQSLL